MFSVFLQLLIFKPKERHQFGFNWFTEAEQGIFITPKKKKNSMALNVWPSCMAVVSALSERIDMNSEC